MAVPYTGETYRDHWLARLPFEHHPDRWKYLEFFQYEKTGSSFIREGQLKDAECLDWLNARRSFELPRQGGAQLKGGQRLLYTHREPDKKAAKRFENTIPCSKSMFEELCDVLKLPAGWCHDAHIKDANIMLAPKTLWPDHLIFTFYRYTTKGDFALATSTDMATGITTAFAYGNDINHYNVPILEEVITLIRLRPLISNPLAFALALLQRMLYQAECFLTDVRFTEDTISAGLQFADQEMTPQLIDEYHDGKIDSRPHLQIVPSNSPFIAHEMTRELKAGLEEQSRLSRAAGLNLMNKKVVSSSYYLTYNIFRHCDSLLRLVNDVMARLSDERFSHLHATEDWDTGREMLGSLVHIYTQVKWNRENLHTRLQMLVTTLHNRIAQEDNSLSYSLAADTRRIAAASRRDSAAMKTIAVLTAVFLPGTFVATIFGMNLFEFTPQKQTFVISKSFWMYCAIAIPLTLLVMVIWLLWFNWSQKRENQRMDEEEASLGKVKMM